jgi:WD40 repeat protein
MVSARRWLIVATLVSLRLLASSGGAAETGTTGERPRLVVQAGHITAPYSLGLSPDGRRLITADMDNVGILWDVATGKELRRFCPPGGSLLNSFLSFTDNRFSSGGQYIFSQTSELFSAGLSRLWDTTTGREIQSWQADDRPLDVAFSLDGLRMATVGKDQHLRVWDMATGRELRSFRCFDEPWFKAQDKQWTGWFSQWKPVVKFSRFGGYLFTEAPSGVGAIWDTPMKKIRHRLNGDLGRITCATFSSDDAFLAVGGDRGTIGLWDVANGRFQRSLVGHRGAVKEIRFSSTRRWITTVGDASDGTLRIWDAGTGRQNAWFRTYYPTLAVGYAPDGRHAATGHADGTVRVWELVGVRQTRKLVGHAGGVKSLGFSADGKWLLTHGHDNTARVWNLGTGMEVRRFQFRNDDGLETGLTVTPPNGDDFVVGGDDGIVRVLNNARGERGIGATALSPDGGTIALGGEDGEVRLLDRRSGRERRTISAGAPVALLISHSRRTERNSWRLVLPEHGSSTWIKEPRSGPLEICPICRRRRSQLTPLQSSPIRSPSPTRLVAPARIRPRWRRVGTSL